MNTTYTVTTSARWNVTSVACPVCGWARVVLDHETNDEAYASIHRAGGPSPVCAGAALTAPEPEGHPLNSYQPFVTDGYAPALPAPLPAPLCFACAALDGTERPAHHDGAHGADAAR